MIMMDFDGDEDLVTEADGGIGYRHKSKQSWCQRYGVLVVLVAITVSSCLMSILTAIIYYSKEQPTNSEYKNPPPPYSAYSRLPLAPPGNHSMDQEYPAYAHKVLDTDFHQDTAGPHASPEPHLLHLNPLDNNKAFEVSEGVTLMPYGIQIEQSGTYFVYKSLFFQQRSRLDCEVFNKKGFVSRLMQNSSLNSKGTTTTLLSTLHTCCPSCQDSDETAFSGGVFYFQTRDILQVEVVGEDFIDVERDVSYFGLMKLGTLH